MSGTTDAQWSAMSKLVQSFIQRPDTEPFRAPVDWKGLGLYDYPQLISRPMDLGTVKKKIADRKYRSIPEAAEEVRLVWKNCMTYNADGSDFFLLAKSLDRKFEEKYSKLCADLQVDAKPGASTMAVGSAGAGDAAVTITLDEKKSFARSLYKLSKEDLGKIIVELDTKCPAALTKNMAEDEATLNVDKIPPDLFQELKDFVAASTKNAPPPKAGTKRKKDA